MKEMNYYFNDLTATPFPDHVKKATHPWDLVSMNDKIVFEESNTHNLKDVSIKGNVFIGKDVEISPYVVIEGPVYLGERTVIRPHAWIRPNTIVGRDCVIGKGTQVKNAFIFDTAKIGDNCFVGDSVLGKGARVGSGVILANRRFDQKEITVKIDDDRLTTSSDKFGAIVGEYSRIGANCTTSPGTLIGQHTWIASTVAYGCIPQDTLVLSKMELVMKKKQRVDLKAQDQKGKI